MLCVVNRTVTMLNVNVRTLIMPSGIMLNVIMLFAEFRYVKSLQSLCSKRQYTDCHYAKRSYE
jgi:hypothetical protein